MAIGSKAVKLWDKSNNIGDPATLNPKKYPALMECIINAEDEKLKRTANIEIAESQKFNIRAEGVINTMTQILKEKLGEILSSLEGVYGHQTKRKPINQGCCSKIRISGKTQPYRIDEKYKEY